MRAVSAINRLCDKTRTAQFIFFALALIGPDPHVKDAAAYCFLIVCIFNLAIKIEKRY